MHRSHISHKEVIVILACILASVPAAASEVPQEGKYAETVNTLGDKASSFTYPVDAAGSQTNCIIANGGKMHVYTDTYLRTGASDKTDPSVVIPDGGEVLVWGYCENGWTKVFYQPQNSKDEKADGDKAVYEGYIKSDLLQSSHS